ncbi:MAG: hypothetical protein LRY55_09095 [Leadbetterella sp.]|nr:hypothetical protein [Leadbetterella sp.]
MNINYSIAKTYVLANKKLTAVAVLGVVLGMAIYIFMNCLIVGFDGVSYSSVFKSTPHIRLFQDDVVSAPLVSDDEVRYLIINPKVVPHNNRILNPYAIKEQVMKHPLVKVVTLQVSTSVFYRSR